MNTQEQTNSSSAKELVNTYFKTFSSSKSASNFIWTLIAIFIVSAIWASYSEISVQFSFFFTVLAYGIYVFGKVLIKNFDSRISQADTLARTLNVTVAAYNELEEELESYKQAHQKNRQVVAEWEKANAYLKAENTNLTNNFSNLQDSYDSVSGRCNIAEKNIAKYKSELEGSDKIIKEAQSKAYIQAIEEYEELVTLNRSIPQLKDEDKKAFSEDRRDLLQKRIDLAKARSEQVSS